jgi:hypothetical protein
MQCVSRPVPRPPLHSCTSAHLAILMRVYFFGVLAYLNVGRMVLVTSLWRNAEPDAKRGKCTAVPKRPDSDIFSCDVSPPLTNRPQQLTRLPAFPPPTRGPPTHRRPVSEKVYRAANSDRLSDHSARDTRPGAANFVEYANSALRSGRPVFLSQHAPLVSPHLGPIDTSTLQRPSTERHVAVTPRNVSTSRLTSSALPSPRSTAGSARTARSTWSLSGLGGQQQWSPQSADSIVTQAPPSRHQLPPRYFHKPCYVNGYEHVGSTTTMSRDTPTFDESEQAFDSLFLSRERARADIEQFDARRARGR